ncbi:hypothetical protein PYK79_45205 [Streptomyces sp. ID05-04B]|uniref:hypothetical protein n=1 Tax=Bacillati TaxID=1783272 RepID=UPI000623BA45|nr:hypothetical protein [Streptomyces sp. ID05-04B]MDX5569047.1 hypothetical protein [Streptomyces sp. ID05-04B]
MSKTKVINKVNLINKQNWEVLCINSLKIDTMNIIQHIILKKSVYFNCKSIEIRLIFQKIVLLYNKPTKRSGNTMNTNFDKFGKGIVVAQSERLKQDTTGGGGGCCSSSVVVKD